jgi:hypothetical protein
MGIFKSTGDIIYTLRFLRLLTTPWERTKAYEYGIIDKNGKRLKSFNTNSIQDRDAYNNYYTPFIRLVFNVKRLINKLPLGKSRIASYAAALYLLKDKYSVNEGTILKGLKEFGIDSLDFLEEQTEWFVLEDQRLSPGVYKVMNEKMLNDSLEEMVNVRDKIRVDEDCYPVGEMFGINIYEVTHIRTNKQIYISIPEITR